MTFAETGLCSYYKGITLQITATCERPTTRSQVYQYEVAYNSASGIVEIQYDKRRGAENSTVIVPDMFWSANDIDPTSNNNCDCSSAPGGSMDSYYSGYGGGVGGGASDGGNGGGKAISGYEVTRFKKLD